MRADSENHDPQPTVYVVDDDAAVRDSLRWLLESAQLRVQDYESAEAFLAVVRPDARGCLILDVQMPVMTGPELFDECKRRNIGLPTLFLSGHGDVPLVVEAIRGGALDYLTKPCDNVLLLARVRDALAEDEQRHASRIRDSKRSQRLEALTAREREILEQVVAGRSNKEVGRALGISYKTVEAHRGRLMRKMGAVSFAALMQMMLAPA